MGGRVTHTIAQGVTASIQLQQSISLDALAEGSCQIQIDNRTDGYESPPMRALIRRRRKSMQGRAWSLELVDEASWKMSQRGQSLPTFIGSSSTAITTALATLAGVTVTGMPDWPVLVEDIKQAQLSDALRRMCAAMALETIVTASGAIVVVPVMWSSGNYSFRPDTVEEVGSTARRFTGLRVEKSSPISSQFCFVADTEQTEQTSYHTFAFGNPLTNVQYTESGVSGGAISYVVVWNGTPGQPGSVAVRGWGALPISGPFDPTLPGTHATVVFEPSPAAVALGIPGTFGICFVGSPPLLAAGLDLSFSEFVGSTERPFPQTYSEQLIPTRAAAIANGPGYLRQRNKDAYRVTASGRLHLDIELAAEMDIDEEDGWPASKIETFTHNMAESGFTTSVEGCIFEGEESP